MRLKFEKKDVIFWICIIGAITSLILKQFYSPPFEDVAFAFIIGSLLYFYAKMAGVYVKIADVYATIGDMKGAIGEIKGKIELLPTSENVRGIIREELERP
ncbi:MAG: hypothetical protein QMD80_07490 [archaeon]|nr:hypothetical protein [archaeon]